MWISFKILAPWSAICHCSGSRSMHPQLAADHVLKSLSRFVFSDRRQSSLSLAVAVEVSDQSMEVVLSAQCLAYRQAARWCTPPATWDWCSQWVCPAPVRTAENKLQIIYDIHMNIVYIRSLIVGKVLRLTAYVKQPRSQHFRFLVSNLSHVPIATVC